MTIFFIEGGDPNPREIFYRGGEVGKALPYFTERECGALFPLRGVEYGGIYTPPQIIYSGGGALYLFYWAGALYPHHLQGALYPVFPITCRFSPFYDWESLNPSEMLQFDFLWTPSSFLKTSPLESNNTAFWATKIQNLALNHKDEHIIGLFFHLYHTNHSLGKWRSRNLHFLNKKWGLQPKNFVISSETT